MNMNERIRTHVEGLFEGAPMTRKILDLKEELLANLNSKYDDLVAGGTSPDDAYRTVIAGIGDVSKHPFVGSKKECDLCLSRSRTLHTCPVQCDIGHRQYGTVLYVSLDRRRNGTSHL